ncbi:MAG: hypothetical protein ABIF82_09255 [Planctomycetota bacterium]
MTARRKSVVLIVCAALLLSIAAAPILLPALVPATQYSGGGDYYCVRCGGYMAASESGFIDRRSPPTLQPQFFRDTPLSAWHKEHFGDTCSHLWIRYHGSGTDYATLLGFEWPLATWTMSGRRPRICALTDEDRQILDELHAHDKDTCKLYIELRLVPAAGDACVDVTNKEDIREMLEKLEYDRSRALRAATDYDQD